MNWKRLWGRFSRKYYRSDSAAVNRIGRALRIPFPGWLGVFGAWANVPRFCVRWSRDGWFGIRHGSGVRRSPLIATLAPGGEAFPQHCDLLLAFWIINLAVILKGHRVHPFLQESVLYSPAVGPPVLGGPTRARAASPDAVGPYYSRACGSSRSSGPGALNATVAFGRPFLAYSRFYALRAQLRQRVLGSVGAPTTMTLYL